MDSSLMIAALLIGVIQIILILSVVHISSKTDEISKQLTEMNELLRKKLEKKKGRLAALKVIDGPENKKEQQRAREG